MPKREVEKFDVRNLFEGSVADEKVILKGMSSLEGELTAQFKQKIEMEEAISKTALKLGESIGAANKEVAREHVLALSRFDASLAKERKERIVIPEGIIESPRVFLGSVGATVVPAYNYEWTWSATAGNPIVSVSASRSNGQMAFDIWNNRSASVGKAKSAVGIYFRPIVENGILKIWSTPSLAYTWWTICAFASAHSDAFIGLYVGRYNLSGGFDGAVVNQQISLWNDDSWWSGTGLNRGSISGFPLFAQFNVDRSHYYAIWVWCGGCASGAGWSTFSGSGANAALNVTVPSITWELY